MKKFFVLSLFFALFLAGALGMQNGVVGLNISAALADGGLHGNVKICHVTEHLQKTLYVAQSAVSGHLGHGDILGKCDDDDHSSVSSTESTSPTCECPPGITDCTCADGTAGLASAAAPTAAGPMRQRSF
ncbi:MAG: hypothetical protein CO187_03315 [Zetaproteobacteria bacterium CG_4_9_14_3_um_filter_53_7]|nr:MAG: hypothetical protein CO187_03315 [Zetaproteobacteria bacterium CG_4_9_14_3_um_filter_53_7]